MLFTVVGNILKIGAFIVRFNENTAQFLFFIEGHYPFNLVYKLCLINTLEEKFIFFITLMGHFYNDYIFLYRIFKICAVIPGLILVHT